MKFLRNIFLFIILCGIYLIILQIEMNTIFPHLNTLYIVLIVFANIILFGIALLYFIACISTNSDTHSNIHQQKDVNRLTFNNPPPIISKPIGGYKREQLNEIYLLGILLHQIYYSVAGERFTERLQKEALTIQMRFFITVFPQRNVNEYFDFTENFMSKNESLCSYSVSECIERSIGILSTCNDKQIKKLKSLYKTLTTLYNEIGGGNKVALITFSSMLDSELSSLID